MAWPMQVPRYQQWWSSSITQVSQVLRGAAAGAVGAAAAAGAAAAGAAAAAAATARARVSRCVGQLMGEWGSSVLPTQLRGRPWEPGQGASVAAAACSQGPAASSCIPPPPSPRPCPPPAVVGAGWLVIATALAVCTTVQAASRQAAGADARRSDARSQRRCHRPRWPADAGSQVASHARQQQGQQGVVQQKQGGGAKGCREHQAGSYGHQGSNQQDHTAQQQAAGDDRCPRAGARPGRSERQPGCAGPECGSCTATLVL